MVSRSILHARVVVGAGGGPEKTILNSARYLNSHGYSPTCLYMRHPRDAGFKKLRDRATNLGVELMEIDDLGPLDLGVARRVRRVCEYQQPWIWHGHEYKSNLIGLWLRRTTRMHLVSTVHGWVQRSWKTPLYYALDRLCLRHYDQVICVSKDLQSRCLSLGVEPERCWYVPNGVDTESFRKEKAQSDLRAEFGVPPARLVIGAVGRLSEEKGFGVLLDAVRSLADCDQDFELWILGEGPQRQVLEERISRLELGDRVRLLGYRSDLVDVYAAMDLFVLSSLREGFPNVVLEAMAMELPIVATLIAGVPELIQEGQNGLLIEPNRASCLAEALGVLISDRELQRGMGLVGRDRVERLFSFEARMETVRQIYERLEPE